jgi:hypothetical protein
MLNIMIGGFGTTVVPGSRQKLSGTTNKGVSSYMYRRPILCTLYGAVDFLKVLKIAIGDGDM